MAKIINTAQAKGKEVNEAGSRGLELLELFGREPGRCLNANFVTVYPGGNTKNHDHSWEQVNYILKGQGLLVVDDSKEAIEAGMAIHIPGGERHCYENTGSEPLIILGVLGPME